MPILSVSNNLQYCTTLITSYDKETPYGEGTGFIYKMNECNKDITFLVTNIHVIQHEETKKYLNSIVVSFSKRNDERTIINEKYEIVVPLDDSNIFISDPNIDLCMIPIQCYLEEAVQNNINLAIFPIENSMIPRKDQLRNIVAAENVYMIGYPLHLYDNINYTPVFRRGITASNYHMDYKGKKEFLLDISCFCGSSGSPVFIFDEGKYTNGGRGGGISNSIVLLGIVYGTYVLDCACGTSRKIPIPINTNTQSTLQNSMRETEIYTHVATAVKAEILQCILKKNGI